MPLDSEPDLPPELEAVFRAELEDLDAQLEHEFAEESSTDEYTSKSCRRSLLKVRNYSYSTHPLYDTN